jgi:hypothetical protein
MHMIPSSKTSSGVSSTGSILIGALVRLQYCRMLGAVTLRSIRDKLIDWASLLFNGNIHPIHFYRLQHLGFRPSMTGHNQLVIIKLTPGNSHPSWIE